MIERDFTFGIDTGYEIDEWPTNDDDEPVHLESPCFIPHSEVLADRIDDTGTLVEQMEAQYAGFVADLNATPMDGWIGHTLPLERAAWENLGDPSAVHYGRYHAAQNGW